MNFTLTLRTYVRRICIFKRCLCPRLSPVLDCVSVYTRNRKKWKHPLPNSPRNWIPVRRPRESPGILRSSLGGYTGRSKAPTTLFRMVQRRQLSANAECQTLCLEWPMQRTQDSQWCHRIRLLCLEIRSGCSFAACFQILFGTASGPRVAGWLTVHTVYIWPVEATFCASVQLQKRLGERG